MIWPVEGSYRIPEAEPMRAVLQHQVVDNPERRSIMTDTPKESQASSSAIHIRGIPIEEYDKLSPEELAAAVSHC